MEPTDHDAVGPEAVTFTVESDDSSPSSSHTLSGCSGPSSPAHLRKQSRPANAVGASPGMLLWKYYARCKTKAVAHRQTARWYRGVNRAVTMVLVSTSAVAAFISGMKTAGYHSAAMDFAGPACNALAGGLIMAVTKLQLSDKMSNHQHSYQHFAQMVANIELFQNSTDHADPSALEQVNAFLQETHNICGMLQNIERTVPGHIMKDVQAKMHRQTSGSIIL